MKRWLTLLALLICTFGAQSESAAQGPLPEYYYAPETELGFATCWIKFTGGSRSKIPFLAVVDRSLRTPLGIGDYERDLQLQGRVVFIGDGVVLDDDRNCYDGRRADYSVGAIDVTGQAVLLCLDCSKTDDAPPPLGQRLAWAVERGAVAAAVFSVERDTPTLTVDTVSFPGASNIPAVTITKDSALRLLASAGENGRALINEWEETGDPPFSRELISTLELSLQGRFDIYKSPRFSYRFLKEALSPQQVEEMSTYSEQALTFISELLPVSDDRVWPAAVTTFFPDFDSKVFYTLHWGMGLSTDAGTFMVWGSGIPSYDLIVHETAHLYTSIFWSQHSSSFLHEGLAMYAQAQAVDPDQDHREIAGLLKAMSMLPLAEIVDHQIGMPGKKTDIGYPASGSFVGFLTDRYGQEKVREAYVLEGRTDDKRNRQTTWSLVFGKTLAELEHEWLEWLQMLTDEGAEPESETGNVPGA